VRNASGKWRAESLSELFLLFAIFCSGAGSLKAGEVPRTSAELNRWYAEPATNGAVYFLQAFEVFSNNVPLHYHTNQDGQWSGYIDWPPDISPTNRPLSRTVKSSLAPFIRGMDLAWPLLKQGAECEENRYPVNLTSGWDASLLHLSSLKAEVIGCRLSAIVNADAQQADVAADSVLMALSVAQSLKAEPLLLSQQIRGGFQNQAIEALEQVINRVCLPTNTLERLQQVFNQLETEEIKGESFERAWIGEKVMADSYLNLSSNRLYEIGENLIANDDSVGIIQITTNQIPSLIVKALETRSADRKLAAETYDNVLSIWKQGYPQRFEIDEIFQTFISGLAQRPLVFMPL
jgi:hypothetical protein